MEYHKIQTMFKRDLETHKIIMGDWSMPEFKYLQDNLWVFDEKVDGTCIRVMWGDGKIKFGGKTAVAQLYAPLVTRLQDIFLGQEQKFADKFGDKPFILYGEGYGAKIQKGGGNYNPKGVDFVSFDARVGSIFLQRKDVEEISGLFGVQMVPTVLVGTLSQGIRIVADGFKSNWGDFIAEGIVGRPITELQTRMGHRVITKIKRRDFNQG